MLTATCALQSIAIQPVRYLDISHLPPDRVKEFTEKTYSFRFLSGPSIPFESEQCARISLENGHP